MFKDCTMTQETIAEAEGPGYRLAIVAAPILCVDPSQALNPWPHAAVLEVTNTAGQPVEVEHNDGSTAGFSFRADRVSDARNPLDGLEYETGPISVEEARVTSGVVAAGATYRMIGDPRYILQPIELAKRGLRVDGSPADMDERFDRSFRVEFFVEFVLKAGGKQTTVQHNLPAMLRIIVRDEAND